MLLKLSTWNGHNINDTNNYKAWFDIGQRANLNAEALFTRRPFGFPYLSGKVLYNHVFIFNVQPGPSVDYHIGREILKGWFDISDFSPHTLVAQDTNDSNRNWYLSGLITNFVESAFGTYTITLSCADPIWRTVDTAQDVWNITATAQTRNITTLGNIPLQPVFTVTPTGARGNGGYAYKRWIKIHNPIATSLSNYPTEVTNGGFNTASIIQDASQTNQINQVGGITAGALSIPVDTPIGGGLPVGEGMAYVDSEQIYYTSITAGVMTVYDDGLGTTGRGWGGTTAATHADNALMKWSRMMANGNDLRVLLDAVDADRWITGINTASTKVWINANWRAKLGSTITVAIAGAGAVTTISIAATSANRALLIAANALSNKIVYIGSEAFSFTGVNYASSPYKFTGVRRAVKGTSQAAHSIGSTFVCLDHDLWMQYGNPLAELQDTDDTKKPMLDLALSTNNSWVLANYLDLTASRPAEFRFGVQSTFGDQNDYYTGNQGADADPATHIGFKIAVYVDQNITKAPTARCSAVLYNPVGFNGSPTYSGSKYAFVKTSWPSIVGLQKSTNGQTWITVLTEAVPTVAATWQAFGPRTPALGGTFPYIAFAMQGSIAATPNHVVYAQFNTITLPLDNTRSPSIVFGAEQNQYSFVNARITNTTTGEFITITYTGKISEPITIDCNKKTVTYSDGDTNIFGAVKTSTVRQDWLNFVPGLNTIKFDDVGTGLVTIATSYQSKAL